MGDGSADTGRGLSFGNRPIMRRGIPSGITPSDVTPSDVTTSGVTPGDDRGWSFGNRPSMMDYRESEGIYYARNFSLDPYDDTRYNEMGRGYNMNSGWDKSYEMGFSFDKRDYGIYYEMNFSLDNDTRYNEMERGSNVNNGWDKNYEMGDSGSYADQGSSFMNSVRQYYGKYCITYGEELSMVPDEGRYNEEENRSMPYSEQSHFLRREPEVPLMSPRTVNREEWFQWLHKVDMVCRDEKCDNMEEKNRHSEELQKTPAVVKPPAVMVPPTMVPSAVLSPLSGDEMWLDDEFFDEEDEQMEEEFSIEGVTAAPWRMITMPMSSEEVEELWQSIRTTQKFGIAQSHTHAGLDAHSAVERNGNEPDYPVLEGSEEVPNSGTPIGGAPSGTTTSGGTPSGGTPSDGTPSCDCGTNEVQEIESDGTPSCDCGTNEVQEIEKDMEDDTSAKERLLSSVHSEETVKRKEWFEERQRGNPGISAKNEQPERKLGKPLGYVRTKKCSVVNEQWKMRRKKEDSGHLVDNIKGRKGIRLKGRKGILSPCHDNWKESSRRKEKIAHSLSYCPRLIDPGDPWVVF